MKKIQTSSYVEPAAQMLIKTILSKNIFYNQNKKETKSKRFKNF